VRVEPNLTPASTKTPQVKSGEDDEAINYFVDLIPRLQQDYPTLEVWLSSANILSCVMFEFFYLWILEGHAGNPAAKLRPSSPQCVCPVQC
jgi:hypothetical protein